jgi:carboxyl-terminal processing protease
VGETTFGTGTVLNQFGLADGSALLLATQEWLTPSGRVIWHKGIAPDIQVALQNNATPLTPSAAQKLTLEQVQESGDAQLVKALELLGAPLR